MPGHCGGWRHCESCEYKQHTCALRTFTNRLMQNKNTCKTHTKPNVILVSVTRHDKGRQRKVVIVASGGEIELERVCSRLDRNMLTSEETVLRR